MLKINNKLTCFKNGRPRIDWLNNFMKRNNLSLKKGNLLSQNRRNATENPFIIFHLYDFLENIIADHNLSSQQIWNADETAFPLDAFECKVIAAKGKTAFRITKGPGGQNISVLASINAGGRA